MTPKVQCYKRLVLLYLTYQWNKCCYFTMNEWFPKCFHGKIIKEVNRRDAKGVGVKRPSCFHGKIGFFWSYFTMNEPFPKCFHGKIIKEVQKGDAKGVRVDTLESMAVWDARVKSGSKKRSLRVANCKLPLVFSRKKKPSFVEQGVDDAKSTVFQTTSSSLFDFSMK